MESRRLKLRPIMIEDTDLLIKWYKQEELMKHVGYEDGLNVEYDQLKNRIINQKNNEKLMMITLLDDTPIGECSYYDINQRSCKVGIKICDLNYQGKGYGKEGLQMLLAHLFGVLGIKMIFVDVLKENIRSQNLFKGVGFLETAVKSNAWTDPKGNKRDAVLMTVTLDDFKKSIDIPFKVI